MIYTLFSVFIISLGISYFFLIQVYLKNWNALPNTILPKDFIGGVSITVVIPIRNEAENIHDLLQSILSNNYPDSLLDIIVVDDHSSDDSAKIVNSIDDKRIKLLSLSKFKLPENFNSFKKFGIEQAVKEAQGELIITTDGDCLVPKQWLNFFAYSYEVDGKKFIAAPVNFNFTNLYLNAFQCLDFLGMMLVTGANIKRKRSMMCNGANMGYSKELFLSVGAYTGLKDQASGDDVMLLNKVAKVNAELIGFIKNKDATVHTKACETWNQLIQQRLRWATKNSSSNDWGMKSELGVVYLASCVLVLQIPLFLIMGKSEIYIYSFMFLFLIIFIGNFLLLRKAYRFFDKIHLKRYFRISFWIHLFYIVIIGTLSLFKKKYTWKGRDVK